MRYQQQNVPSFTEPHWVTREEVAEQRGRWYGDQRAAHYQRKRRQTHKLLLAARAKIRRLRAKIETNK